MDTRTDRKRQTDGQTDGLTCQWIHPYGGTHFLETDSEPWVLTDILIVLRWKVFKFDLELLHLFGHLQ